MWNIGLVNWKVQKISFEQRIAFIRDTQASTNSSVIEKRCGNIEEWKRIVVEEIG